MGKTAQLRSFPAREDAVLRLRDLKADAMILDVACQPPSWEHLQPDRGPIVFQLLGVPLYSSLQCALDWPHHHALPSGTARVGKHLAEELIDVHAPRHPADMDASGHPTVAHVRKHLRKELIGIDPSRHATTWAAAAASLHACMTPTVVRFTLLLIWRSRRLQRLP